MTVDEFVQLLSVEKVGVFGVLAFMVWSLLAAVKTLFGVFLEERKSAMSVTEGLVDKMRDQNSLISKTHDKLDQLQRSIDDLRRAP